MNRGGAQDDDLESLLDEQSEYYRERAPEYDDWWFRRGRYDHGAPTNDLWFADAARVRAALDRLRPYGDVVELASGTGLWSEQLLKHANHLTVVDNSTEMLRRCFARIGNPGTAVSCVEADLFKWEPERVYDLCFFSFWLSHVPDQHFDVFWEKVKRALKPNGRVFFVDSRASKIDAAIDRDAPSIGSETAIRRLADGRDFRIVKRFREPQELERRLSALGWLATVRRTPRYFIYGHAKPGHPASRP